jgi:2,5-diamino-6-(ribosylamino)-4(3H)-pyrimidinone 5'-phosphate reductase
MRPHVILHNAVSLDGRIDHFPADIGLYYEIASRWNADAMLAGSNTIIAASREFPEEDDAAPEPPAGDHDDPRPLLVVPDSRGRIRFWHLWQKAPYWRGIIVLCSNATPEEYREYLKERGIGCIVAGDDHVDMRAALEALDLRYGVKTVRLDSGGTLNGVLLREGLVDEVSVLIHPSLVGGTSPRSIYRAPDLTSPEGAIPLRLTRFETMQGDIVWLVYEVIREC